MATERRNAIGRRSFLLSVGSLAATPLFGGIATQAVAQTAATRAPATEAIGRRRLGSLEVSSIGLGVQNMSRTYQTTMPSRPEMINIIRAAFDRGVTFFDAAEAYGPHEVERILGEGIAPFRDKVVITSKFGWNIDLETGERRPGLNSKPEHIKLAVEGMLKRLRTDRIDLLYQHRVDPEGPDRGRRRRGQGPDGRRARSCTGASRRWGSTRCAGLTPRCRSPPSRTSTRCCGAGPRSEVIPTVRGAGHRLRAVEPARRGSSSPAPSTRTRGSPPVTSAASSPASRRRICRTTWRSSNWSSAGPNGSVPLPPRSRSPGCWRRSPGSCPSPGRPRWRTCSRTSARLTFG